MSGTPPWTLEKCTELLQTFQIQCPDASLNAIFERSPFSAESIQFVSFVLREARTAAIPAEQDLLTTFTPETIEDAIAIPEIGTAAFSLPLDANVPEPVKVTLDMSGEHGVPLPWYLRCFPSDNIDALLAAQNLPSVLTRFRAAWAAQQARELRAALAVAAGEIAKRREALDERRMTRQVALAAHETLVAAPRGPPARVHGEDDDEFDEEEEEIDPEVAAAAAAAAQMELDTADDDALEALLNEWDARVTAGTDAAPPPNIDVPKSKLDAEAAARAAAAEEEEEEEEAGGDDMPADEEPGDEDGGDEEGDGVDEPVDFALVDPALFLMVRPAAAGSPGTIPASDAALVLSGPASWAEVPEQEAASPESPRDEDDEDDEEAEEEAEEEREEEESGPVGFEVDLLTVAVVFGATKIAAWLLSRGAPIGPLLAHIAARSDAAAEANVNVPPDLHPAELTAINNGAEGAATVAIGEVYTLISALCEARRLHRTIVPLDFTPFLAHVLPALSRTASMSIVAGIAACPGIACGIPRIPPEAIVSPLFAVHIGMLCAALPLRNVVPVLAAGDAVHRAAARLGMPPAGDDEDEVDEAPLDVGGEDDDAASLCSEFADDAPPIPRSMVQDLQNDPSDPVGAARAALAAAPGGDGSSPADDDAAEGEEEDESALKMPVLPPTLPDMPPPRFRPLRIPLAALVCMRPLHELRARGLRVAVRKAGTAESTAAADWGDWAAVAPGVSEEEDGVPDWSLAETAAAALSSAPPAPLAELTHILGAPDEPPRTIIGRWTDVALAGVLLDAPLSGSFPPIPLPGGMPCSSQLEGCRRAFDLLSRTLIPQVTAARMSPSFPATVHCLLAALPGARPSVCARVYSSLLRDVICATGFALCPHRTWLREYSLVAAACASFHERLRGAAPIAESEEAAFQGLALPHLSATPAPAGKSSGRREPPAPPQVVVVTQTTPGRHDVVARSIVPFDIVAWLGGRDSGAPLPPAGTTGVLASLSGAGDASPTLSATRAAPGLLLPSVSHRFLAGSDTWTAWDDSAEGLPVVSVATAPSPDSPDRTVVTMRAVVVPALVPVGCTLSELVPAMSRALARAVQGSAAPSWIPCSDQVDVAGEIVATLPRAISEFGASCGATGAPDGSKSFPRAFGVLHSRAEALLARARGLQTRLAACTADAHADAEKLLADAATLPVLFSLAASPDVLARAVSSGNVAVVRAALRAGAAPIVTGPDGGAPISILRHAVQSSQVEVVHALVDLGFGLTETWDAGRCSAAQHIRQNYPRSVCEQLFEAASAQKSLDEYVPPSPPLL